MSSPADPILRSVLVIEDDRGIRDPLVELLEFEGHRVETADNGQLGLARLNSGPPPAVILLDMMMPVMGGRQFLNEFFKNEKLATIPVIVISANAPDQSALGATAYLRKPLDIDLLFKLIHQLTARDS